MGFRNYFKGRSNEIFLGLLFIILGFFYYRYEWSFRTGFPVPRATGILIIFVGIFSISYGLIKKVDSSKYVKELLICPKCKCIIKTLKSSVLICPDCKTVMEDLEGFHKRHPELKDDSIKT